VRVCDLLVYKGVDLGTVFDGFLCLMIGFRVLICRLMIHVFVLIGIGNGLF
jgi:hypothetical protein